MRLLTIAALAFAASPIFASADTVTGTVTYLQRFLLPPDATLEVVMQDTSLADAPAKTLATYKLDDPGSPPYAFAFKYDPETIDEARTYTMRATVHQGDTLLMTTDTVYPVLTRGAGSEVEMVMKMVASADEATPGSDILNTHWKIVTLNGADVPVVNDQKAPHVVLKDDGSYSATVGCNMINGGHEVEGAKVTFKPGMTTLMACPPPLDELERRLTDVLGSAVSFGINGNSMEFVDGSGGTLATFMAIDS